MRLRRGVVVTAVSVVECISLGFDQNDCLLALGIAEKTARSRRYLSVKERSVLRELHRHEDLTQHELALMFGVTRQTVHSTVTSVHRVSGPPTLC